MSNVIKGDYIATELSLALAKLHELHSAAVTLGLVKLANDLEDATRRMRNVAFILAAKKHNDRGAITGLRRRL